PCRIADRRRREHPLPKSPRRHASAIGRCKRPRGTLVRARRRRAGAAHHSGRLKSVRSRRCSAYLPQRRCPPRSLLVEPSYRPTQSLRIPSRPSIPTFPEWALGASLAFRIVNALFMWTTDNPIGNHDTFHLVLQDEGEYFLVDHCVGPGVVFG